MLLWAVWGGEQSVSERGALSSPRPAEKTALRGRKRGPVPLATAVRRFLSLHNLRAGVWGCGQGLSLQGVGRLMVLSHLGGVQRARRAVAQFPHKRTPVIRARTHPPPLPCACASRGVSYSCRLFSGVERAASGGAWEWHTVHPSTRPTVSPAPSTGPHL